MKKVLFILVCLLLSTSPAWGVQFEKNNPNHKPEGVMDSPAHELFRHNIPSVAQQFVGIPYKWGGNPQETGTSDNSYLFFSIYSLAAQHAGLAYHGYLPMRNLLQRTEEVSEDEIRNGDLMVLNNNHAAMVYKTEGNGILHLIYASEKRQQVISFNSDNLVFNVYWLENLKGFYRLSTTMLRPDQ